MKVASVYSGFNGSGFYRSYAGKPDLVLTKSEKKSFTTKGMKDTEKIFTLIRSIE